jgi:hypothetical protein
MTTHVGLLVLFSFFVSLIFSVIAKDEPADQFRTALRYFAGFVGAGLLLGWIMFPLPF